MSTPEVEQKTRKLFDSIADHSSTPEQIQTLIDEGANPEATNGTNGTALHFAVHHKRKDLASVIIKAKPSLINENRSYHKAFDTSGERSVSSHGTPLHAAVYIDDKDMVLYLIENGANIDSVDVSGHTPIYAAALQGKEQMVRLLKNAGADVKAAIDMALKELKEFSKRDGSFDASGRYWSLKFKPDSKQMQSIADQCNKALTMLEGRQSTR